MFRKKYFEFNGTLHKEKKLHQEKNWEYHLQVIICGTKAKDVLKGMKIDKIDVTDDKEIYGLYYIQRGDLKIDMQASLDTTIHFEKVRNKKLPKTSLFTHKDDKLNAPANKRAISYGGYQLKSHDFKSDDDILVVIAPSDKEEELKIGKILEEKLGARANVYSIAAQFPNSGTDPFHSWSMEQAYKIGSNTPHAVLISDKDYVESFAERVKKKMKEITETFASGLTKQLEEQAKTDMLKEMEDSLHQRADEHFKQSVFRK